MDSKLQIISGRFRGRKISVPFTARPTQNRARQALFNMLTGLIDIGAPITVWDAFAGSGAFGLECISRYPNSRVIFTDTSAQALEMLRHNLLQMNVLDSASVICSDACSQISRYGPISDIVFLDPPYAMSKSGVDFMTDLGAVAKSGALLVWEQDTVNFTLPSANWDIIRDRRYGRARFLILRKK